MVDWTEVPADKGLGAKQEQDQGEGAGRRQTLWLGGSGRKDTGGEAWVTRAGGRDKSGAVRLGGS